MLEITKDERPRPNVILSKIYVIQWYYYMGVLYFYTRSYQNFLCSIMYQLLSRHPFSINHFLLIWIILRNASKRHRMNFHIVWPPLNFPYFNSIFSPSPVSPSRQNCCIKRGGWVNFRKGKILEMGRGRFWKGASKPLAHYEEKQKTWYS